MNIYVLVVKNVSCKDLYLTKSSFMLMMWYILSRKKHSDILLLQGQCFLNEWINDCHVIYAWILRYFHNYSYHRFFSSEHWRPTFTWNVTFCIFQDVPNLLRHICGSASIHRGSADHLREELGQALRWSARGRLLPCEGTWPRRQSWGISRCSPVNRFPAAQIWPK